MFDRRDENDTLRDVAKQTEPADTSVRKDTPGREEDGTGLVPDALGKREVRERRAEEREAQSGSLGTGIGDDRPGGTSSRDDHGE